MYNTNLAMKAERVLRLEKERAIALFLFFRGLKTGEKSGRGCREFFLVGTETSAAAEEESVAGTCLFSLAFSGGS